MQVHLKIEEPKDHLSWSVSVEVGTARSGCLIDGSRGFCVDLWLQPTYSWPTSVKKVTDQATCDLVPLPWVGLFGTHASGLRRIKPLLVIPYCL